MLQKLFLRFIPVGCRIFIATLIISYCFNFCKSGFPTTDPNNKEKVSEISWNVSFKPGASTTEREAALEAIRDSITNYYANNYPGIILRFGLSLYCICDSTLYNMNIKLVDGMGQSASSPPPPPPGPSGSGDYASILFLANNNFFTDTLDVDSVPILTGQKFELYSPKPIKEGAVLAVIDTGIDTTLFTNEIGSLIWRKQDPARTFFNFLPFAEVGKLDDDHKYKHGSAVTALALQQIRRDTDYPRLMVLKALDEKKRGSTFTVSCAMSYAIQNNATLINASLGYYGPPDPVLQHYIERALKHRPEPIPLYVAAGNVEEQHNPAQYCATVPPNTNELGVNKFVFPACYSRDFENVITITNLNQTFHPCFYQNYSKRFVSLGVVNPVCCQHGINFMSKAYEGSSFATPVASGTMMDCIIRNNFVQANIIADWTNNILKHYSTGIPAHTVQRKYILSQQ